METIIGFMEQRCQAFENAAAAVYDRVIQSLPKQKETIFDKMDRFLFRNSSSYRAHIIRSFVRNADEHGVVSYAMYLHQKKSSNFPGKQ